jgi:hypothetical protein
MGVFLFLTCVACDDISTAKMKQVTAPGKFSISIPQYLEETDNLNPHASIQYQHKKKNIYLIVIDNDKSEIESDYSVEGHYDLMLQNLHENIKDIDITKKDTLILGNSKALSSTILGQFQNTGIFYKIAAIETPKGWYQLFIWTHKNNLSRYEKQFEDIIASFKEL